jgi:2,3-dihydroxyphenylpropionate 1,2-dioxygenase
MTFKTLCLSHAPLIDYPTRHPEALAAKARLDASFDTVRRWVTDFAPTRIVIFAPDHITGLHMDVMPQFCIMGAATAINDFGGIPGKIPTSKETAFALVDAAAASGVDLALSMDGKVDHGVTQPLKFLFGAIPNNIEIIPILMNCHQRPITFAGRSAALGAAIGEHFRTQPGRTLFIGSGGLSHDPQFPQYDDKNPVAAAMTLKGKRMGRIMNWVFLKIVRHVTIRFGKQFRAGIKGVTPLNPDWDAALLAQLTAGTLEPLHTWTFESILPEGGTGGQEMRTWLAALSAQKAASGAYNAMQDFYASVPEWGIGCGVMRAEPV